MFRTSQDRVGAHLNRSGKRKAGPQRVWHVRAFKEATLRLGLKTSYETSLRIHLPLDGGSGAGGEGGEASWIT